MMEVDDAIAEAIQEGIKAGVFRRAARLNPKSATMWNALADEGSSSGSAALKRFVLNNRVRDF